MNDKNYLESEISKAIRLDNGCVVRFEHKKNKGFFGMILNSSYKVDVFTDNPKTKEIFLLKQSVGKTPEEALRVILDYVNNHKKNYSSYTVDWAKVGDNKGIQMSYFYCHDIKEAIDKFYFNKERDEYIVYSVKINPIA